jgi:tetratricopeptide (TPR) repeat protein
MSAPKQSPAGRERPERRIPPTASVRAYLAVALLALIAHGGSLRAGFVYDDVPIVVENPETAALDRAGEWFTSGYWPGHELYYRPLLIAGFALERALFGGAAAGAHAVNLAWHVCVALLVTCLAERLVRHRRAFPAPDRRAGLVAGALFAVHPLLTEPVYWISARADLLGAAATLGALLIARARALGEVPRGALVGLVTLGGLLCKETVAVVPVALLLDALWRRRHGDAPHWRPVLLPPLTGALLAAIAYVALRALAFGSTLGLGAPPATADDALHNPLVAAGAAERWLTPFAILTLLAARTIWPERLSSDYAFDSIPLATHPGDARVVVGVLLAASMIALAARSSRRDGVMLWGFSFAALTWLPASNTILLGGALFGERFAYLPAAGIAAAVAASVTGSGSRRGRSAPRVLVMGAALLLIPYVIRDHVRSRDWRSNESLYASVVRSYPTNAQGHYNLGTLALERAMREPESAAARVRLPEEAEARFRLAARIRPDYLLAHMNAGVARAERGDLTGAIAAYRVAEGLAPDDPRVHYNLGVAFERLGQRDAAVAHYERSAAAMPGGGPAARALRRLVAGSR